MAGTDATEQSCLRMIQGQPKPKGNQKQCSAHNFLVLAGPPWQLW